MDDLSQQINQILSDPQSMQQIQSMMSALGMGGQNNNGSQPQQAAPQSPPQTGGPQTGGPQTGGPQTGNNSSSGFDPSALAGMLNSLGMGGGNSAPQQQTPTVQNPLGALGGVTPEMLQMISRVGPLLSQVNREDDSTRLLRALRPLLGAARQKKLDEAIKILQMMRLLPLLKDSGLFSGLLSGLL